MTGKTISEKLLSEKSGRDVRAGDYVEAEVDVMMTHDVTGPLTFEVFEDVTGDDPELVDPDNTVITIDHHAPADGVEAANNHNIVREFADTYGAQQYDVGDGICHQVLVEEGFVSPGDLVIGADSHSTTFGGVGGFGTGVGSTDLGTTLATGELWFRVPETLRFEVEGDLPDGVYAKDLILKFIGDVGFDGCTYKTAEYGGSAVEALPIHERLVLSNMAIEMGGKAGIVPPDERTLDFLEAQTGERPEIPAYTQPDDDADYEAVHTYQAESLSPQVSTPSNPENAVPVDEVVGTEIDQLFVGTCTNGRYEDIRIVADIIEGEQLAPDTRMVVVPASRRVQTDDEHRRHENVRRRGRDRSERRLWFLLRDPPRRAGRRRRLSRHGEPQLPGPRGVDEKRGVSRQPRHGGRVGAVRRDHRPAGGRTESLR